MGASGCAYMEATRSETLPDWLGSHVRALEYYGSAPTIIVPDNARVGVTRADRYVSGGEKTDEIGQLENRVLVPEDAGMLYGLDQTTGYCFRG